MSAHIREAGQGLRCGGDVVDDDTRHPEPDDGSGGGHPVVRVRPPLSAVQSARSDGQCILRRFPAPPPREAMFRSRSPPAGRFRGPADDRYRRVLLGESAKTATAATVGVSSPTSCRSMSMPRNRSGPVTVHPSGPLRGRPSPAGSPTGVAGLIGVGRPVRNGDLAAGDRCCRQKRGGVGEIGFDDQSRTAIGPGSTRQRSATASSTTTPTDRMPGPSSRCAASTAARPFVQNGDAIGEGCGAEQQPGDELGRRTGIDPDAAAAQRPGTPHGEGQTVAVDVGAEPAQRVQHRRHRPAAGGSSPSMTTCPVAVAAKPARTASRCRPDRSRSPRTGQRAWADRPVGSGVVDVPRARARPPSDRCPDCAAAR